MQLNLGAGVAAGWLLATVLTMGAAPAQEPAAQYGRAAGRRRAALEVWDNPALVDDAEAHGIQYLGLNGRYQGQLYSLNSSHGSAGDWENRQSRAGLEATVMKEWELYTSFNLSLEEGALLDNIDEAYLSWKPRDEFQLLAGKMKIGITPEYRTSSKLLITPEISQIANQVSLLPLWGVQARGSAGQWLYEGSVSSSGLDPEFRWPTADGGVVTFLSAGYRWETAGTTRAEWMWSDGGHGGGASPRYENVFSVSHEAQLGERVSVMLNGVYGDAQEAGSDVWGAVVMPSVMLTDSLQAVARLTISHSGSADGLLLQKRYEQAAPDLETPYARNYRSIYAGMNYYVHNHRLKLTGGVEYTSAEQEGRDFEAVTAIAGVRLFIGKGKTTVP